MMKKFNFKNLFLFLGLVIASSSCIKSPECGDCTVPPSQLYFKFVDAVTNENLFTNSTYSSDSLKLYYLDNQDTNYLDVALYGYYSEWIVSSPAMSTIAYQNTEETFYLQLNHFDTDTIYMHVGSFTENCCTYYVYDDFKVNGKEPLVEQPYNMILIKK